ncbi:MAG: hypothetical protein OIN86_04640 [Candidatus Methanoperedens sp.]|nr:hypothetical protein [Candidatus Methanoperedens sp.]
MEIQKTRQSGNSVVISLTGFAKIGEHYKIEKKDENTIILTRVT